MRMRLSPDCSKLVMCTTGGYMVLVHNLSLEHLAQDLQDFKVCMCACVRVQLFTWRLEGDKQLFTYFIFLCTPFITIISLMY